MFRIHDVAHATRSDVISENLRRSVSFLKYMPLAMYGAKTTPELYAHTSRRGAGDVHEQNLLLIMWRRQRARLYLSPMIFKSCLIIFFYQ